MVTRCLADVVTGWLLKLVAMNTSPSATSTAVAPSYYERHIFFCTNQRDAGKECCAHQGAAEAFDHCKAQAKALGLLGAGKVRVNKAGCLDRCAGGPIAVVYPEAVWYTYVDKADIDEIVASHLANGQVVTRLLTPPDVGR